MSNHNHIEAYEHKQVKHFHCSHLLDKIHVITIISNPVRYDSRYNLYRQFEKHMRESGVIHLHTIEVQQQNRQFQITSSNNPYHLQLRTSNELWIKENALNKLIHRISSEYRDAHSIAWIDAD